ncbi:serine hydrolase domain-containing protein [Streptomyces sp. NRRL F-5053]|uniref:serine hydrolase domain-containing protein n=1 Tax=Streptomyces sp. NRRL F-5053 TaxID=1463854 RepID=UPI0013316445|nr:serine hydrolase domain-containing protein [Streptomyces sp. NRRL F-5053]
MATGLGIPNAQLAVLDGGEVELAHAGGPQAGKLCFPFASATKLFTATVAMQLVRDGDLELDAPVGRYSDELETALNGMGSAVTVRQLLRHTSGLVCDVEGDAGSAHALLAAAGTSGLLFRPGAAFSYSNVGFALVGRLIESAAGVCWREAVDTFLLRPLGTEPAHLPVSGASAGGPPLATGHTVTATGTVPVRVDVPAALAPAAALAGTAEDLLTFARLHLDERGGAERALLDDEGILEMRRPAPDAEPYGLADGWGLGWGLYGARSSPWLGLDAMGGGTTCNLRAQPQEGKVLVLLTDSTAGLSLWRGLAEWLSAQGHDIPAAPVGRTRELRGPSASAPADWEGTWVNGTMSCRITRHAGVLRLEDDTEARYRLELDDRGAFSAHRIDVPEAQYQGRFLPSPGGGRHGLMQFAGRVLRKETP